MANIIYYTGRSIQVISYWGYRLAVDTTKERPGSHNGYSDYILFKLVVNTNTKIQTYGRLHRLGQQKVQRVYRFLQSIVSTNIWNIRYSAK
jgi:hypothetical protein